MSIKRIDRTKQLMGNLEKAASQAVKEAAIMLKVIAREMVSRPYTKKQGTARTAAQQAAFEARRRSNARKYFLSLPPKGVTPASRAIRAAIQAPTLGRIRLFD